VDPLQLIVLALVQGLTEFLPISSSAHLVLVPVVTGWPDQGLAFDVAVHVGTLLAVAGYFRAELAGMARDLGTSLARGRLVGEARLACYVALGTVPVGAAGLAVDRLAGEALRSSAVIGAATLAFGVLLWWADRAGARRRDEHTLGLGDAVLIGLAQALALIPGTSRSGITMTAGLALGLTREAAARFSFLLSIPVIALAGGLKTVELAGSPDPVAWGEMAAGVGLSAACAYLVIHFFLGLIGRIGMGPFVVYRLVLGVLLLAVAA